MNPMTSFIVGAALLVALVTAILLRPLLQSRKTSPGAGRREINLAIFSDQLAELERDRAEGSLAEADFEQAKNELHRRVLEDVRPEAPADSRQPAARKTAFALLAILPLAAAAAYLLLGNPRGLDPMQTQARLSPQQMEAMVDQLAGKLKRNPDDAEGWIMLARSYKVMGRYAEAADAYAHAGARLDKEASLLADYAEVLSQAQGGNLGGKAGELIARALQVDPDEPQALLLAGAAASDRRDFLAAADYWERLLRQLEPGSEEAETLKAAVAKAREVAAQGSQAPAGKNSAVGGAAITGEVTLDGKLAGRIQPGDVLFVFARAEGSRMPLAAIRAKAADLPLRFRLEDANSLPGGARLSSVAKVSVEARIARAGEARSSSGDLYGVLEEVKVGAQNVRLRIDRIQP